MANATLSLLLFRCLIIAFCCRNLLLVHGARELLAYQHHHHHHYHHHASQRKAPVLNSACHKQQLPGLEIVHRNGPCSPFGQGISPRDHHRILFQDGLRVDSINQKPTTATPFVKYGEDIRLPLTGLSIGAGNFVVKVGFGTNPTQNISLILDTGSELTWIKCQPCSECYPQQSEMFSPLTSSTFSKAPCDTPECKFSVDYFDGSHSDGYMAQDTLTIGNSVSFPEFIFGCGQHNTDDFGQAAGILGLGQNGALSLLPQTQTGFASIFCYCLPKGPDSSGYLLFGMEALMTCQTEKYTPILKESDKPYLYFVRLQGITIGQKQLDIAGKTIVDSGTVISRLPPSIYEGVLAEFKESMKSFPDAEAATLLKDCYNLEGSFQDAKIPSVELHLDNNVNLQLDSSAVVWRENGDSQVCLAFAPNKDESDLTIIGNHQLRSMNLLYNVQDAKLEFGEKGNGC